MSEADIYAVCRQFEEAFGAGDAAGIAMLYTEHGQVLPPNAEILEGHAAIQGFWQSLMDAGVAKATLSTTELDIIGSMAVEVGNYEIGNAEGGLVDRGKYMVIWQFVNGQWRLYRDIFNSSQPAPQA